VDLWVTNFIESDQRPERSLKNLSPLLGTGSFESEEFNLRKGERFPSPEHPALRRYNVKDTVVTLRNYEVLRAD
jgi:hypothetical protein